VVSPDVIRDGVARLKGSSHRHLTVVLRLEVGSPVDLLDGSGGRHEGILETVTREESVVRVSRSCVEEPDAGPRLTLLYGLSKGRRTEMVLQKATELGVDAIFPCLCQRSVARPKEPAKKHQRWSEIVAQAARQCDRARLPLLAPLGTLESALEMAPASAVRLLAVPGAPSLSTYREGLAAASAVCVVVGPEGGLTDGEVKAAVARGYSPVGLGPRVLRTETAAISLVSTVGFLMGKWG